MKYFTNCKTAEDVKATFKDLAKKLHPDNGGDAEAFKAMMQEYTTAYNRLKDVHANAAGETYKKATTQTAEQFADIITQIISCDGLQIEICGSWVWVTGNTYAHRETLKKAGFTWSKSKRAWYNAGEPMTGHRRGRYTMAQIRMMHGSEIVETTGTNKIA